MDSFAAVSGSSSKMEGGAVVSGVSPTTDTLCLYMLISSVSEPKSVSTVDCLDSRLSSERRKAPGLARKLCASVRGDRGGESREMERWEAVSASESWSCWCGTAAVGETGGRSIMFVFPERVGSTGQQTHVDDISNIT